VSSLTSSKHLYQPVKYSLSNGAWKESCIDAISSSHGNLTWDVSTIASILCLGYSCGDSTLFKELSRSPWLSKIENDNSISYEVPPEHDTLWFDEGAIAQKFIDLLISEAKHVCQGRKEIYLLLSGGLDSRIVAGVLSRLLKKGLLSAKPVAVTWGLENSRDVVYGKATAEISGFDWQHVDLNIDTLRNSLEEMSLISGGLVSPIHFHSMGWFKNVSKDAIVLAASYGDSIGRAEFSGKILLELDYLKPFNMFGLLRQDIFNEASQCLTDNLKNFHKRFGQKSQYVICEYEQQGHYMRGMIGHTMNVINNYCSLYQMFTAPEVYGYMWSIHPSLRTNRIYALMFDMLDSNLARLPWARTNRALSGTTSGALNSLKRAFHNYTQWISGPLFNVIDDYFDPQWLCDKVGFDKNSIMRLRQVVKSDPQGAKAFGYTLHDKWVWLASLRNIEQHLSDFKLSTKVPVQNSQELTVPENKDNLTPKILVKKVLTKIKPLYTLAQISKRQLSKLRRIWLYRKAKYLYPPKY